MLPYAGLAAIVWIRQETGLILQAAETDESTCEASCAGHAVHLWMPWAFLAIEFTLLACAYAASAKRRSGRPGRVTSAFAALLTVGTLGIAVVTAIAACDQRIGATIYPLGVVLFPLLIIGLPAVLIAIAIGHSYGAAAVLVVLVLGFLWHRMRGPIRAKATQFAAWLGMLAAAPFVGLLVMERVFFAIS